MDPFNFMGDLYNDGMPLGLSAALVRSAAAYNYFLSLGDVDSAEAVRSRLELSGGKPGSFVGDYENWSLR